MSDRLWDRLRNRRIVRPPAISTVLVVALATAGATAQPPCAPSLRVGNIALVAQSGCESTYQVDAICTAAGSCATGSTCVAGNALTWDWTVVQTGGTGSFTVDRTDWTQIRVTVVPPVKLTLQCEVGGCQSCCVVPLTTTCLGTPVTAPPRLSNSKSVTISACP